MVAAAISTQDRPLERIWVEEETTERTRRYMTAQRCQLMEAALERVGFARDTIYGRVAVLLAKLAVDWQPVQRELGRLASDREIASGSQSLKTQKDVVRRALKELAAWGVIAIDKLEGAKRRRTKAEVIYSVRMCPRVLKKLADGHEPEPVEIATDQRQRERQDSDNGSDNTCDRPATTAATDQRQYVRQDSKHSLYKPLTHKPKETLPPPPQGNRGRRRAAAEADEVVLKFLELGVARAHRLVHAALDRGCSTRHLLAIAKWGERMFRLDPRRYRKPASVLMIRLEAAMPKLSPWKGWPDFGKSRRFSGAPQRRVAAETTKPGGKPEASGFAPEELSERGLGAFEYCIVRKMQDSEKKRDLMRRIHRRRKQLAEEKRIASQHPAEQRAADQRRAEPCVA